MDQCRMCHLHKMEYHLVIKRNKVLIHATGWIDHEYIMPGERSQSQEMSYCIIPCVRNAQKKREQEKQGVGLNLEVPRPFHL